MSAPLSERCICESTPATDPTLAEHAVWCPSRKPTADRLAEIKAGTGRPLMAGELEWLRGDANRDELHVIGARGGHWPLTDDLPGAVLDLARKLGAMVAEVDRLRTALNQSENDLTGARLSLWEGEQEWTRVRLALASAQRGRSKERTRVAELEAASCSCLSPEFHQPECSESRVVLDDIEYSVVHWYTDADGTWLLPVSGDELRMQVEGDSAYEPIPIGELVSDYGPLTRTEFDSALSRDEIRELQAAAKAGDPS